MFANACRVHVFVEASEGYIRLNIYLYLLNIIKLQIFTSVNSLSAVIAVGVAGGAV